MPLDLTLNDSTLCARSVFVFCRVIRTNSNCFPTKHLLIGFYKKDRGSILAGKNRNIRGEKKNRFSVTLFTTNSTRTNPGMIPCCIARAERDGTQAETRFRFSPKRTSPFKSVGASVQSTAGSRGVRISFSNAGYATFGGGVRVLATHSIRQFPLHFPSRASPCATRFRTSSSMQQ